MPDSSRMPESKFAARDQGCPGVECLQFSQTRLDFEPENPSPEPNFKAIEEPSKEKKGWKRFAGIFFTLFVGICMTGANLLVKVLKNHHPLNLVFWRYASFLVPIIPYLIYLRVRKGVNAFSSIGLGGTLGKNFAKLFLLSICAVTVFILRFYSLMYLSIADSAVIVYSGPIFTIVLAHFALKEKCGVVMIALATFTLLGVLVISRPPFLTGKSEMETEMLIGAGLAFSSTLLGAIYFILMRGLREVNFSVVTLFTACVGLAEAGALAWAIRVFQVPSGAWEVLLVSGLGILSFLGSVSLVLALKFEEAGTVSVVRMVDVLYSYLFQFLFIDVVPDVYSIIGATIVMSGVLLITFRKVVSTLPKDHGLRTVLGFLLK